MGLIKKGSAAVSLAVVAVLTLTMGLASATPTSSAFRLRGGEVTAAAGCPGVGSARRAGVGRPRP